MKNKVKITTVIIILILPVIYIYSRFNLKEYISDQFLIDLNKSPISVKNIYENNNKNTQKALYNFTVVSDIHNDTENLSSAITKINKTDTRFILGLGDYTNVGSDQEFRPISEAFKLSSKPIYMLPGDHDHWASINDQKSSLYYYKKYLDVSNNILKYQNSTFIPLDNSDLYDGVTNENLTKFKNEIGHANTPIIVIYMHKAIDRYINTKSMGYIGLDKNDNVLKQKMIINEYIKEASNKKTIFLLHGDLHSSGSASLSNTLKIFRIGALTNHKNFQTPRYSQCYVYISDMLCNDILI